LPTKNEPAESSAKIWQERETNHTHCMAIHDLKNTVSERKKAKLLFFWDYDTQWGADRSRREGGAKNWGHLEFENTERLLELHGAYQVPACFAVVGSAALHGTRPYHDPVQIQRIHMAGHEVASHSHRHEWLPGLDAGALRETLLCSRDALEQCIGAPVRTFVPPYNQPFDYPAGWSFSLSERREAGSTRTDLLRLCEALRETGYEFCRVAYQPLHERLAERLLGRRCSRSSPPETISGIACVRLNTPGGFAPPTEYLLNQCVKRQGWIVVYGHPHSLTLGNAQDEKWLTPFLQKLHALQQRGALDIVLPRDLL
jgi:hypothetical protein